MTPAGGGGHSAGAPVQTVHVRDLDSRRGWARIKAAVYCVIGVFVFALSAAALAVIVIAGIARFWSFWGKDSIKDAPMWSWAPGGAGALAIAALVFSFVWAFLHFWLGAARQVLREVAAGPVDPFRDAVVVNVVEALSIGIGKPPPAIAVVDDVAPNAVGLRGFRKRVLVVTTGLSSMPRDEVEAVCAHELGHMWAADSHFVTSGLVALARAKRFSYAILALGIALFLLVIAVAKYTEIILWSTGLVAGALVVLGAISGSMLDGLAMSVRGSADEIADVLAIRLARNPASLGNACARMATNPDRVRHVSWRSEMLWFETVEEIEVAESQGAAYDAKALELNAESRSELIHRALKAYAEARVPPPESLTRLGAGAP